MRLRLLRLRAAVLQLHMEAEAGPDGTGLLLGDGGFLRSGKHKRKRGSRDARPTYLAYLSGALPDACARYRAGL